MSSTKEVFHNGLNVALVAFDPAHNNGKATVRVFVDRSTIDGTLCVWVDGPFGPDDSFPSGHPKIRVYLNDETLYEDPSL